ncbi:hypothetical protein GCM10007216_34170 [Thalassobacillus devorans]|uniref:DUF2935 domain-containing protein n=1 Tax=Thalassobacillus devorans TaxID=279813 RepID=A0ABQ1PPI8_9BACI|nr:DUF2935 domain-containing protein [Thalassobacillus devorans]NIK30398.1 hypothetical protein [Thalassobacillus devorans]GGD00580.1 hypothetical protein GCM10007216_34170 [Thalassobacillus devorans]
MRTYLEAARFEHAFWLQILGDHARFIRDSLYPSEKEDIEIAKAFIEIFDDMAVKSRDLSKSQAQEFTRRAGEHVRSFRQYKLSIIRRLLEGEIEIHLPPTFINHMVNELEEYLLVIGYLGKGEVPPVFHELHHHMLWLLDASGHAGAINDSMDATEQHIKKQSDTFRQTFNDLYLKSVEMTGYLRANLESFPALSRFNNETKIEMKLFQTFLKELEEMELSEQVLGTFTALMADHMFREECYYLFKVAESTAAEYPSCDPTKPRVVT